MAPEPPSQSERKPAADYVGHPAMDPGTYHVHDEGIYRRPGLEGVWCKRIETWRESGELCGAWHWVRNEERML